MANNDRTLCADSDTSNPPLSLHTQGGQAFVKYVEVVYKKYFFFATIFILYI